MSVERIFSINPYNDSDIKLVEEYENSNNLNNDISNSVRQTKNSMTKEQYLENKKNSNEIDEYLYIEKDSKLIGCCQLHGEKDIKSCKVTFLLCRNTIKTKKMISLVTDFIINTYGMQEIFTNVKNSSKEMINALSIYGYENLGEEDGEILFLKEHEYYDTLQRAI